MKTTTPQTITAYKALSQDFTSHRFQYQVGQTYTHNTPIQLYITGFHATISPLELIDRSCDLLNIRFVQVQLSGQTIYDHNSHTICASQITIIRELQPQDLIRHIIQYIDRTIRHDPPLRYNIDAIASQEYNEHFIARHDHKHIATSGAKTTIAIDTPAIGTTIATSGNHTNILTTAPGNHITASGSAPRIISTGNSTHIATTGGSARILSTGHLARITATGDYSQVASTGDAAIITCTGNIAKAKARKGSYITLTEYARIDGYQQPTTTKTQYVDGIEIQEDTWYQLINGKFTES